MNVIFPLKYELMPNVSASAVAIELLSFFGSILHNILESDVECDNLIIYLDDICIFSQIHRQSMLQCHHIYHIKIMYK